MSESETVLTETEKQMVLAALRHHETYLCKIADDFPTEVSRAIVADAVQRGELYGKITQSKSIRLQSD